MSIEEIIKASENYYFIVADGKIYTSEGYASDIHLGEEVFDLTFSEKPKEEIIKNFIDWFLTQDYCAVDANRNCLLVGRDGKYADALKAYRKEKLWQKQD